MTQKTKLYQIVCGLAVKKLALDESFNPDDFIGKEYMIIVAETNSGATRVETVLPVDG